MGLLDRQISARRVLILCLAPRVRWHRITHHSTLASPDTQGLSSGPPNEPKGKSLERWLHRHVSGTPDTLKKGRKCSGNITYWGGLVERVCNRASAERHKHVVATTGDGHRDIRRHAELREDAS